jgi:hypothetical protein
MCAQSVAGNIQLKNIVKAGSAVTVASFSVTETRNPATQKKKPSKRKISLQLRGASCVFSLIFHILSSCSL